MKNGMKTAALLAFLGALFMVVGGALGGSTGLLIGLLLGLAFCGGTYWFSDKLAIASARAKPVTREEDPELYAMVDDLSQRAQIPMPRVYMSPEQQPNAFATGRNPKHAVVCVTAGLASTARARRGQRCAGARDGAREAPRHPHRLGRCRGRDGDHVRRQNGAVGNDVRRR